MHSYKVKYEHRQYRKVTFTLIGLILSLLFWFVALQGLQFMYNGLKDPQDLRAQLAMIPEDAQINDTLATDMLITAWDYNNRSPRFFTKVTSSRLTDPELNHNLPLKDMTWASASTQYYFRPSVIGNSTFMSGDNVAQSPAMFAFYYANEIRNVSLNDIRVVSVGSTRELPEKISN